MSQSTSIPKNRIDQNHLDSFGLRSLRKLDTEWPSRFRTLVLPRLRESQEIFAPLYSENSNTRPSTPTFLVLAYLLLQRTFNYTDDQLIFQVTWNVAIQYAIGTENCPDQMINQRTLNRFRCDVEKYARKTGINLISSFFEQYQQDLQDLFLGPNRRRRMDSVMIDNGCRKLSRLQTAHVINRAALELLEEGYLIPRNLTHYLESFDENDVVYHQARKISLEKRTESAFCDMVHIRRIFPAELYGTQEYINLCRVIEEQVILDEKGRFKALRPGRELTSQTLNNPAEPESTIRKKAGKVHQGWVGHFAETVDLDTGRKVIDSCEFEQNICSDVEFCSREIEKMAGRKETGVLVADGAYISDELIEKAADHDIELMGTDLTGKDTPDMMADFVIHEGEDGETEVICPNGKKADRVSISGEGSCSVSYLPKSCNNCLHQGDCPLKKGRRVRSGKVSAQQIRRAKLQRVMKTEEYKEYSRFRNGVEAIPSQLRRNQGIDKIPARGALRKKNRFTIDLMAINTRRALRYALEDHGKPQNWEYSNFWSALMYELYKVFHNIFWKWELLAVPS